jgi:CheY-like chemotaxis protein/anti-sigma regulatory factor (Ser/Thr protein kinase)
VLARETSALFSSQAESKGLEFITQVDESVPSILLFDSLRIRQVVNNLVANAIKFTDQGHVAVYFSASPSENKNSTILNISIEDTGSGISHSEREVIFKPFVQKRGQKLGGTGLGLAISKRLIESMNGTISLRSEPGKGCKFEVSFKDIKVERLTKDLEPQSDKKARNFQFEKQKVLVVDDARSNRELLTEALSAVGLTVWAADDGQQAIDMAQKYEPELIIMDIRMPVKDGVQAAKEIKAIMKVPIIALTASLSATQEQLTTVFDGYLHKPVKLYDLFSESGRFLEFSLGSQIKSGEHKSMEPSVEAFEQVVAPRELAKKIGQNLLKKIDEFSGAFCISDIKDFASELKIMAKKHSFNLLALEADSLYQAAGHYDTMLIKSSVKRINKILSLFLNFFQQNP